jgi:hypothetical protein
MVQVSESEYAAMLAVIASARILIETADGPISEDTAYVRTVQFNSLAESLKVWIEQVSKK